MGAVLQALADPTRRQIFERLARSPLPVTSIAEPLAMSLPAVMKHLAVLEGCGLIETRKIGRTRTCTIRPQALRALDTWLRAQRTNWEQQLDALGDHLSQTGARAATDAATEIPTATATATATQQESNSHE